MSVTQLIPQRIGESQMIVEPRLGKTMFEDLIRKPNGHEYKFFSWGTTKNIRPVMVLPLTEEGNIVAVEQYREAADQLIIEVPGGNPKGNQTDEEVARAELLEEAGMEWNTLILMTPKRNFWEPASLRISFTSYLAFGCRKVQEPKPDKNEFIALHEFPLPKWLEMIYLGEVTDPKTIVTAILAMRHLGITFNIPPIFNFNKG